MHRVLLSFLLLLTGNAIAADDSADLRDFQQRAAEILEVNDVPGAGIALVKNGEVLWAGGIGYADYAEGRYVLSTTRFRVGSITKMFTALAVLQLVEEGRFSLDDPVRELAPEIPIENPWHANHPVRIAHLLEHTAGFDDMHFRHMNSDDALPDSLRPMIEDLAHELRMRWQPGVKYSYSNPGYAVAGYLVEKYSGQPFHRYIDTRVLAPLGMARTGWGTGSDDDIAQGYTTTRGGGLREVPPRAIQLYPAGELSASPQDLARLVRLFLQRGEIDGARLIGDESLTRMETSLTSRAARHGLASGYGLANATSVREGFRLHGHNGGLDGFIAELAYSIEHDFGYAVLLNRADPGTLKALGDLATQFLARDIVPVEPGTLDAPGAAIPRGIAGCYRMSNSRNEILHGLEWLVQVTCAQAEGERVLLRHPLLPPVAVFLPAGGGLLRETHEPWPSAVFMHDEAMPDALEWSGIYFERSHRAAVTLPLAVACLALLLMLSSIAFAPVWLLRRKFGALKRAPALSARVWPLAASVLFMLTMLCALRLELSLLDSVNPVTMGIFAGGLAFALTSLFALYRVMRTWHAGIHPLARWHSLCVALACVAVTLYLVYWKLVPLRLWAW